MQFKDSKGLNYIAQLLRHPDREFHAADLIQQQGKLADFAAWKGECMDDYDLSYTDLGDAGAMLDSQAKAAYKHRLEDLREELEEAQACNDYGRSESAQQEMDILTETLAAAVGLRGKDRRVSSHAERTRVSVTKAIRAAVKKISHHHPTLGHYLDTTLKTGAFCSYTPDLRLPIIWTM